jgi:hypothetical protein
MFWISDSPSAQRALMSKTIPALNGALEHQESYGKGYLPD